MSLTGGAGTGKTLIALAAALEQEKDFDQIILSRPTVVLGGQDIGFLPGDQRSKMSPYVQPLMDNLDVIKRCFKPGSKQALKIESMLKEEKLLISPLAYIRGRSLDQPYLDQWSNGLTHLGEKMNGQPLFQHIFLRKGERSELSDIAAKLL